MAVSDTIQIRRTDSAPDTLPQPNRVKTPIQVKSNISRLDSTHQRRQKKRQQSNSLTDCVSSATPMGVAVIKSLETPSITSQMNVLHPLIELRHHVGSLFLALRMSTATPVVVLQQISSIRRCRVSNDHFRNCYQKRRGLPPDVPDRKGKDDA